MSEELQYISDERGELKSVIIPIELWRELIPERETSYLLESEAMRKRLLEARAREEGIALEDALERLGI